MENFKHTKNTMAFLQGKRDWIEFRIISSIYLALRVSICLYTDLIKIRLATTYIFSLIMLKKTNEIQLCIKVTEFLVRKGRSINTSTFFLESYFPKTFFNKSVPLAAGSCLIFNSSLDT